MKRSLFFVLALVFLLPGCKKDNTVNTSGTVTINNVQTSPYWYVLGFTFSQDKKVSSLTSPGPDVTVDNDGTLGDVRILTNSYSNSFFKAGTYSSAVEAETAFNNLTGPTVPQWVVWADSIKANQVWIFKTWDDYYAKLRIVSVVSEERDSKNYAECTFEWVYQPDGSLTFPGK
jgi:hypothetical protein